jgi:hypothetical protein
MSMICLDGQIEYAKVQFYFLHFVGDSDSNELVPHGWMILVRPCGLASTVVQMTFKW